MRLSKGCFNIYWIAALLLISSNYGCNKSSVNNEERSMDFESVVRKGNDVSSFSNQELVRKVDSAFYSLKSPTIEQQCKRLLFKNNHFLKGNEVGTLYLDSIILLIEKNNLENKLANIYNDALLSKGDTLIKRNDFAGAFNYYHTSFLNIKSRKDSCGYASYYQRLADIEYRQQNYSKAANYNKASFNNFFNCDRDGFKSYNIQQATLDNIALCYDKMGAKDSALLYFNKALDFIAGFEAKFPQQTKKIAIAKGVIWGNMGTTLYKKGDSKTAEILFKKSIAVNNQKGYANVDAQLTRLKLARLYLESTRLEETGALLQEINSSIGLDEPIVKIRLYRLQSDYYAALKQPYLANTYLNTYLKFHDSVISADKDFIRADFNKAFKNLEQEETLSILRKDQQTKGAYLGITAGLLLLVCLIALLIWYNRKKLAQLNVKINAQNADMQTTLSALQQSQEENTRLMKIVAHDLRTPLSITVSIVNIMNDSPHLSDADREMLELMKISSTNAMEMIVDLLNINTTKEALTKESVEMDVLLKHCAELLQIKASDKQQNIQLHLQPISLHVSREKIWRVMSNLMINAIKFSPKGAEINVEMRQENDRVLISIKDQGIGIPEELQHKIFNLFTDAKRLGTDGEVSFGLGLAITKQIVEAHEGKIWFNSEINKGSVFVVELPILPEGR